MLKAEEWGWRRRVYWGFRSEFLRETILLEWEHWEKSGGGAGGGGGGWKGLGEWTTEVRDEEGTILC